jgi:hypothetical protein
VDVDVGDDDDVVVAFALILLSGFDGGVDDDEAKKGDCKETPSVPCKATTG